MLYRGSGEQASGPRLAGQPALSSFWVEEIEVDPERPVADETVCLIAAFTNEGSVPLALFVPAFRDWLRQYLARRMEAASETRVWVDGEEIRPGQAGQPGRGPGRGPGRESDGRVIEGEYRDVSDDSRDAGDDEPPATGPETDPTRRPR